MFQEFKQVLNGKYLKTAISQPIGEKSNFWGHILFSNFQSSRKQSSFILLIIGHLAEIWPFSDGMLRIQSSVHKIGASNSPGTKDYYQNAFWWPMHELKNVKCRKSWVKNVMQNCWISNINYACAKYLPTSRGMDKLCKLIELWVEVLKVLNVDGR